MKLPQILAQADVSLPQRRGGYGSAAGSVPLAAAQGIERVGGALVKTLTGVSDAIQKREDAIHKEEVASEAANLEASFEERLSEIESSVRTNITGHADLVPEWRKLVDEAGTRMLSGARDPAAAAVVRRKMPAIIQRDYAKILKRRDEMRMEDLDAEATSTEDLQIRLARRDGLFDNDAAAARIAKIEGALAPLIPMKGEGVLLKRAAAARDQILAEKLKRLAEEAPETVEDQIDTNPLYRLLPVETRRDALTRANAIQKQRLTEWDKYFDEIEKEAEAERQTQMTRLSEKAAPGGGGLKPSDVIEARSLDIIRTREEFEHYMTLATKPPRDTPSDPGILIAVDAGVWNPAGSTYSAAQIQALMTAHMHGGPGLNAVEGKAALIEIRRQTEFKTSRADQGARDEHQKNRESHQLAMDEGLTWLGITTPLSQLDGPATALVARFKSDLNAVVLDRNGNYVKPSREALYQLLPSYLERQSSDAKLDYEKASGLAVQRHGRIPEWSDEPTWMAWYQERQRAIQALKEKNPNEYEVRRIELMELKRLWETRVSAQRRRDELGGGGGKATPRYKPPGAMVPSK